MFNLLFQCLLICCLGLIDEPATNSNLRVFITPRVMALCYVTFGALTIYTAIYLIMALFGDLYVKVEYFRYGVYLPFRFLLLSAHPGVLRPFGLWPDSFYIVRSRRYSSAIGAIRRIVTIGIRICIAWIWLWPRHPSHSLPL